MFQPVNTDAIKIRKQTHLPHLLICVFVALVYLFGTLDGLEHKLMDLRFLSHDRTASPGPVLVGIDSKSIRDLKKWPWKRSLHADLIRKLLDAGADRIFLDIDLSSASSVADDADLAAAIKEANGKVVLPVFKQRTMQNSAALAYTEPLPEFSENAQTASVNIQAESDSLVRRYNRVETWQGALLPSLAMQLVRRLPEFFDPFYIDYSLRVESIPYVSYVDILKGAYPDTLVSGKIVFVGATAVELGDILPVPVYGSLPGTFVQILAYETLRTDRAIKRTDPLWSLLVIVLLSVFLGPQISAWSWKRGLGVSVGVIGLTYGAATVLQGFAPLSADISPILLVLCLSYIWSLTQQIDIQSLGLFKQHMAAVHTRALMGSVVDESIDGIVITKPSGDIQFVNSAACALLGKRQGDIIGQKIDVFFRTLEPVENYEDATSMAGTEALVLLKSKGGEITGINENKIPVEASLTAVPLVLGQSPLEVRTGNRSVYIYTFHDIRGRQKAELAVIEAAEKAIAADHAKTELLANVSHELRTPLNAIIGFSTCMDQQLFGPLGNDKYQEYAHDILYSGEHLLELVENILTISRVDTDNYELLEEFLDLKELIDDSTNIVLGSANQKRVSLEKDVPDNLPKLFADARSLRQILLNLLGNAVKFTPPDGAVRIFAQFETTGEISITVADNGIGISESDIKRIVEPFEQVESAMNRTHGGAGLGLHIVSGLANLHGGRMDIKSGLGVGTKVSIWFPRNRVQGLGNVVPLTN